MMANIDGGLAIGISIGFVWSSWVAVWLIFLAYFLVPDPELKSIPQRPAMNNAYVSMAAEMALKSTLVAFPSAIFLAALLFSSRIFSARVDAKYYSSALVAMIILFNGSMGEGKNFSSEFISRLFLMSLAGVYVIFALKVLERYWPFSSTK